MTIMISLKEKDNNGNPNYIKLTDLKHGKKIYKKL